MATHGQHAVADRHGLPAGRLQRPTAALRALLREGFSVSQPDGWASGSSRPHAAGLSSDLSHDRSVFGSFSLRDLALSFDCQRVPSIPPAGQATIMRRTGMRTSRPFAIARAARPTSRTAGTGIATARRGVAVHLSASRSRRTSLRRNREGFGNSRRNRGFALEPCAGRVEGAPH